MAPREAKVTPKEQRVVTKTTTLKKIIPTSTSVIKKTMSSKKNTEQTPRKVDSRQRSNTAPTPKPKEAKPVVCPGSVTRSAKKAWKRRPKPAHSGVPVPEKMKRILQHQLEDSDCSF